MNALILDKQYETIDILDTFQSFIWAVRYRGYGYFEIYMPLELATHCSLKLDCYLQSRSSDGLMIVEDIQMDTNAETRGCLTVTGRSLESILERRVIAKHTVLTGNFQNGIERLLNENAIAPSNVNRKLPGFIFRVSNDPMITALTVDTQFLGEGLYDAIYGLCAEKDIGFRVLPEGAGGFVFELYAGKDRSYSQTKLPPVIFSPKFENLISSNYLESQKALKTVAIVAGEGDGSARKLTEATDNLGGGTGLDRRETFVDAGGVSSSISGGAVPEADYFNQLKEKGKEALAETKITKAFEGEIDASRQFIYGKDFFIGDIVQIANELGMEAKSRVSELIYSQDIEGESIHPTFTSVEN